MEETSQLAAKNQEQTLIGKLMQVRFFNRLSAKHIQLLLKLAQPMNVDADEALWMEGDPCTGLYILMQGRLVIVEGGREVRHMEPISPVGELPLLTGAVHPDEVVAHSPCLLLLIPRKTLEIVLLKSTDLCQRICRNVVSELADQLQIVNDDIVDVAQRKVQIEMQIKDAESEFNGLRMIHG